jgi:hypothetical protein
LVNASVSIAGWVVTRGVSGGPRRPDAPQRRGHVLDHRLRFGFQLPFAKAMDRVAEPPQPQLPFVVVLKSDRPAMGRIAVGFNDKARLTPEEIDSHPADRNVDLRLLQSRATPKAKEVALEVAASAIALDLTKPKTKELGLPNGAPHEASRKRRAYVHERARHRRDGNVVAHRHQRRGAVLRACGLEIRPEGGAAVKAYALAALAATMRRDGYVHRSSEGA